jgi:hypothetical protein
MGQRVIAREMHMSRRIVHRFLTSKTFPERASGSGRRPKSKRKLGPYLAYLRERWNAGEHTGSHLFGELKEQEKNNPLAALWWVSALLQGVVDRHIKIGGCTCFPLGFFFTVQT